MNAPAKPAQPPQQGGDGQAAGPLAEAVADFALKKQPAEPKADPAKKWDEMAGELYAALESKDKATFARLFKTQVKLAVSEALRGDKR